MRPRRHKDHLKLPWLNAPTPLEYLPNSKIGTDSSRFCRSTFGVHYDKDLLDAPGAMMMQGLPDMELRWEESDIREGWERSTQVVLGLSLIHI